MAFWHRWFGTPSRDEFAKMLIAEIRRAGSAEAIRYDADEFTLSIGETGGTGDGKSVHLMSLANAYGEYIRAGRRGRRGILDRWARLTLPQDTPQSFDDMRPNLLPRIRDRAQYDRIPLELRLQGMDPPAYVYRVIAEHLALGLVHDLPESIAEMPGDQFEKWGVAIDEAFTIARENLRGLTPRPFERIAAGVFISPYRDNHDASRLVLVDMIRKLQVRGSPVAMVPNRDTLIITGADDPNGLLLMAKMTEAALEEPRPMGGIPVWLDDDTWRPFVLEEDHPHHKLFDKLRVLSLAGDYAAQKELLEALHEKTEENVFVATFTVMEHTETGQLRSYSTWTRDVNTMLPRTDDVMLLDTDAPGEPAIVRVEWERAAEILGSLMKPLPMYPPRFRVDEFPTEEMLASVRPTPEEENAG